MKNTRQNITVTSSPWGNRSPSAAQRVTVVIGMIVHEISGLVVIANEM